MWIFWKVFLLYWWSNQYFKWDALLYESIYFIIILLVSVEFLETKRWNCIFRARVWWNETKVFVKIWWSYCLRIRIDNIGYWACQAFQIKQWNFWWTFWTALFLMGFRIRFEAKNCSIQTKSTQSSICLGWVLIKTSRFWSGIIFKWENLSSFNSFKY